MVLFAGPGSDTFITSVTARFDAAPTPPLLSAGVAKSLAEGVERLRAAGAELLAGGSSRPAPGYRYANTLLRVTGGQFLDSSEILQT